jgi:hypothetical protein
MDGANQNNHEQNYNLPQEIPIPELGDSVGTLGQAAQPHRPQKKKAGRVLIIAACVVAVLGIAGISAWIYYTGRPLYRLAKGFQNLSAEMSEMKNPLAEKVGMADILTMMEEEGSHVESRLDVKSDRFPNSITLGVDTDSYKDVQTKELDAVTNLSIMNYDVAEMELYGTEDVICFSIPKFFMENMYFNTENVVSQYNNSVLVTSGLLGKSDAEDFSIELFPEYGEGLSPGKLLNSSEYWMRYEEAIQACRGNAIIEKASKDVCRVTFRRQDVEAVVRAVMADSAFFYEKADVDAEAVLAEYSKLVSSDVSLLFTLDSENRFESIELEQPITVLDGEVSIDGELFFLGEERTIEQIQGKITFADTRGEETEITGQIEQSQEENDYQLDMELQYTAGDSENSMNLSMGCDAGADDFDITLSMKEAQDTMELAAEGSLDDIVQGESFQLDLDDFMFERNGEQLFQVRGDIAVEPLTEAVTSNVTATTPVFDLTYGDLLGIVYQNIKEYGGILEMLGYQ